MTCPALSLLAVCAPATVPSAQSFPSFLTGFDLVKCEDPGTPNYGYRIRDEGHFTDTVVLYSCNPGYAMHGSDTLTCLSGDRRVWDKPLPSCVGELGRPPPSVPPQKQSSGPSRRCWGEAGASAVLSARSPRSPKTPCFCGVGFA